MTSDDDEYEEFLEYFAQMKEYEKAINLAIAKEYDAEMERNLIREWEEKHCGNY